METDPSQICRPCPDPHKLPALTEAVVVGGLGLMVFYGPSVWDGVRMIRPRLRRLYISSKSQIVHRLEPLRRRLKKGSLVRVVASLLPDRFFDPAGRIFIVPYGNNTIDESRGVSDLYKEETMGLPIPMKSNTILSTNDEDLIIAFELDTESHDGEADESVYTSSNADGWEQNPSEFTIPDFCPGESLQIVSCSTPEPFYHGKHFNESVSANSEDLLAHKKEIDQLRELLQSLMNKATVQDQTIATLQQSMIENKKTPVTVPVISISRDFIPQNVGGPPPPPPPPPPMPMMPLLGSQPFIAVKKGQSNSISTKKALPGMSDVLKDLPKAKNNLKKIARSPGGTPIKKPTRKSNSDLQNALKKRFEAIQISDDSEDDGELMNKENQGFNDTFNESCTAPKRNNFASPSSLMLKKNTDELSRRSLGKKNDAPLFQFGQHLLKKANTSETATSIDEPSDEIQVLRERNQ